MTKLERRKAVVTLYPGNLDTELAEIHARLIAAVEAEDADPSNRFGSKSKAAAIAKEFDAKRAERDAAGVEVTLREISRAEWNPLADKHPPKGDDANDKATGLNLDTFPAALLRVSLASDIDLDELSPVNYMKLERASWELHNQGDDALGKFSAASWLKQMRDLASKLPNDSE